MPHTFPTFQVQSLRAEPLLQKYLWHWIEMPRTQGEEQAANGRAEAMKAASAHVAEPCEF